MKSLCRPLACGLVIATIPMLPVPAAADVDEHWLGSLSWRCIGPSRGGRSTAVTGVRGNFSHGDGVYKSVDAGRTWTHVGLGDTRQIGRIVVDEFEGLLPVQGRLHLVAGVAELERQHLDLSVPFAQTSNAVGRVDVQFLLLDQVP